jgi:16S rRNA (cytosine967-C5)-methyltransferase
MNLRGRAAQILSEVLSEGHSLTFVLAASLPKIPESSDRAFVQAICFGVVRHYFSLDFILNQLLSKPLKSKDADIYCLMLIGIYQLQFMRVKPHAAVSETVAATKHKPWSKSLVNAVLRQFQRDAEHLLSSCSENEQARYNHPQWMIRHLRSDWPEETESILLANDAPPPMVLRVNLLQGNRKDYQELLSEQGIVAKIPEQGSEACLLLDQPVSVEQLPGFAEGRVSVQDSSAQLAALLLELHPGHKVLDLCAAPGGKTAAILERQPRLHSLLAIDVDSQRLQRVSENLQRLKLNAEVLVGDARLPDSWARESMFDRVLLDAPCSGLGVIRRHPDIKLLRRETDILGLQQLQAEILEAAWRLLIPGGLLLYVTCSILKRENEIQIADFLQNHPDAKEVVINADWGVARPFGRQILTGDLEMDGFYYAKLAKSA